MCIDDKPRMEGKVERDVPRTNKKKNLKFLFVYYFRKLLIYVHISIADGVGFEPTRGFLPCLISSEVLSTTQPPIL